MKFTVYQKSYLIISILIFLGFNVAVAQNTEMENKNSVYGNYGNLIAISQASISYERLFLKKEKLETRVKLNYGNYLSNNLDFETNARVTDSYFSLSAVQLIGILELNAGVALENFRLAAGFEPDPDVDYSILMNRLAFYGNIGIRYSKKNFLIRAGFGNLELLHVGVGLNF